MGHRGSRVCCLGFSWGFGFGTFLVSGLPLREDWYCSLRTRSFKELFTEGRGYLVSMVYKTSLHEILDGGLWVSLGAPGYRCL